MDPLRRTQLIKQRAVARGMLTCIQSFIDTCDQKINDIQVRFNKLPDIFCRYDTAQSELELSDDVDHSAHHRAVRQDVGIPHRGNKLAVRILSYQSFRCQLMTVTHVIGYNTETHLKR